MLPGHTIKSYGLIECDKLYPLIDFNDKYSKVTFHVIESSYVIRINSISA
jgi:hypothetical protein